MNTHECPICNDDENCPGKHELWDIANMTRQELKAQGLRRISDPLTTYVLIVRSAEIDDYVDAVLTFEPTLEWCKNRYKDHGYVSTDNDAYLAVNDDPWSPSPMHCSDGIFQWGEFQVDIWVKKVERS